MAKEKSKAQKALERLKKINPHAEFISTQALNRVTGYIDTGSMGLNAIISGSLYGGVPSGKIVQFCGESQTFKSGYSLQIAANAQKNGKVVTLFDTEGAISADAAKSFGLNVDELILMPCDSIEQVRNDINNFCVDIRENGEEGDHVIIIDSLANLESELNLKRFSEGSTSADMGSVAKAVKSLLKTCTNKCNATNTALIVTNHVYDNPAQLHESLEKIVNGGKAAVYLPTVTVQLSKILMKEGKDTSIGDKRVGGQKNYTGVVLKAVTVKNRLIQPLLECKVYLSFKNGMDKYFGLKDLMSDLGVIVSKGATYEDWEGNKLGFYKAWVKDTELWETKLLPELEKRIQAAWKYSSVDDIPEEDVFEDDDES